MLVLNMNPGLSATVQSLCLWTAVCLLTLLGPYICMPVLPARLTKTTKNKFSLSTLLNVSLSIHRLWAPSNEADDGVPSSFRIIQDITKYSRTYLLQIIEARGALVAGIGNRNGVRKRTMGNWGGPREKKPMAYDQ